MGPMEVQIIEAIGWTVGPAIAVAVIAICITTIVNTRLRMEDTRMRIKNGYPLTGGFGQAIHPKVDQQTMERIGLLSSENAQLRAELGSVKDRLATLERIITDDSHRLTQEIESLGAASN
jgi:hypothetical protein